MVPRYRAHMRALVATAVLTLGLVPAPAARAVGFSYVRPVHGEILRHFEPPPTPYSAGHRGIDMAAPEGTPVLAAAAGTVAFAGQVGGSLYVSIDHADGLRSTYSFLSLILVDEGATVAQGEPIALSGPCHAGAPSPCLHFGIKRGDEYLDPESMLLDAMKRDLTQVLRLTG